MTLVIAVMIFHRLSCIAFGYVIRLGLFGGLIQVFNSWSRNAVGLFTTLWRLYSMKVRIIGLLCLLQLPGDYGRDAIVWEFISPLGSFMKLVIEQKSWFKNSSRCITEPACGVSSTLSSLAPSIVWLLQSQCGCCSIWRLGLYGDRSGVLGSWRVYYCCSESAGSPAPINRNGRGLGNEKGSGLC